MMNGYFDNAATTYKKPEGMYEFISEYMSSYGANVGRGEYNTAMTSGKLVSDTRNKLLALMNAPEDRVAVFTPSATIALNMLIFGLGLKKDDVIYISPFEHNAVLRPLYHLQEIINIQIQFIPMLNEDKYEFDLIQLEQCLKKSHPKAIVLSQVGNVLGNIAPANEIGKLAAKYNVISIVDGSQSCGVIECDLHYIDYYVFDGHKTLLGPTGIGGFICKKQSNLAPYIFGGTGKDSANHDMPKALPERYEAGTMNLVAIAGLNYSVSWIINNLSYVRKMEKQNRERLYHLLEQYNYLSIISPFHKASGIVSCKAEGFTSDEFGKILSDRGIAVRTGLHCAPKAHEYIGSFPEGLVRFSVSALTVDEDFRALKNILDELSDEII